MTDLTFEQGCIVTPGYTVCGPGGVTIREWGQCQGLCGEPNARLVVREPNSGYYAPTISCACGDTWDAEEGLFQRPFKRGWRAKAKGQFEDLWEKALPEGTDPIRGDSHGWLTGVVLPDGTEVTR